MPFGPEAAAEDYYRECDPLNLDAAPMSDAAPPHEFTDADMKSIGLEVALDNAHQMIGWAVDCARIKTKVQLPRYAPFMARGWAERINPLIGRLETGLAFHRSHGFEMARTAHAELMEAFDHMDERISDWASD